MHSKNYLFLVLCFLALKSFAQQGTLDSTFSGDGILILTPSSGHENANRVLIQPDSAILFVGGSTTQPSTSFDIITGRLHPDGTLDSSFGTNGYVILDYSGYYDMGYDIDLSDEGKILVTGSVSISASKSDMFIMRLMPTGAYDTTFGDSGRVDISFTSDQSYARETVIQPDGKIVLGGYSHLLGDNRAVLVRLNDDGSLDSTFGTGGISIPDIQTQSEQIESLIMKPNGSFIAVGYETAGISGLIAHTWGILPDGSLDTSFGNGGTLPMVLGMGYARSIVSLNDQYYICGYPFGGTVGIGYIIAISDSGTFIPTFGFNGVVRDTLNTLVEFNNLTLQQDGKIVTVGGTIQAGSDFLVTRFNTDGTLDPAFGSNGHAIFDLNGGNNENSRGVAIQADGKIVVCGTTMVTNNDIAIIRLDGVANTTGLSQLNLQENSVVVYPNPSNGNFIISFSTPVKNQTVKIINTLGEKVFTVSITNDSQKEINLQNISSGIYFVEIIGDEGKIVRKILVQ